MNKRSNFINFIVKSRKLAEFAEDVQFECACIDEEAMICKGLDEIYLLIRYWSEGRDFESADTLKPTYFLEMFKMLFESPCELTYKEIVVKIGGADIKNYLRKCNKIATAKARQMGKENEIHKKILIRYYENIKRVKQND